jgi:ribosomal protein S18 acetylase RimI-like enzyme
MPITYTDSLDTITPDKLRGFFVGWPTPPSPETHLRILLGRDFVWVAVNDETGIVVGFITAISDGVSSAYIPFLEVLPPYQGQGVGTELARRMLDSLRHLYMVDLVCDDDVMPFYERLGMRRYGAMIRRNYDQQNGT